MTTRKIFSIIGIVLTAFLIGNMFFPFLSNGGYSVSFWEYFSDTVDMIYVDIIILIELIVAILFFVLQICGVKKDSKFVYFTVGYYLTYHIATLCQFIKADYMEYTSVGFWCGFIVSIILLAVTIIGNLVSNEPKARVAAPVVSYDPQTGQPITQ